MPKVRIGDQYYEFDFASEPLAEMLALEKALNTTYGQWKSDRQAGTARAIAGLIWLIWKRNGRDVDFADIESGKVPLDLADWDIEDAGEAPGPTSPPTGASSTTAAATSARSRKS